MRILGFIFSFVLILFTVPTVSATVFGKDFFSSSLPRDKDKDGVPDEDDMCPDEPGWSGSKGCPDDDRDYIPNDIDKCPLEYGTLLNNGCPDTDNDGVVDKFDNCKNEKGLPVNKGCPDDDNDGVINAEDKCPTKPGYTHLAGCPDKDRDGVHDDEDACPTEFGLKQFAGCSDKDGDGVSSLYDQCPTEKGVSHLFGCPDSDGDGIADREDKCPYTAGKEEDQGCPFKDPFVDVSYDTASRKIEITNSLLSKEAKTIPTEVKSKQVGARVDTIYFKSDSYELADATSREGLPYGVLNSFVKSISSQSVIHIEGHTDNKEGINSVGREHLASTRIEVIKDYLMNAGIDESKIEIKVWADKAPALDPNNWDTRKYNRRVVIKEIIVN